ncbi:MAG: transporter substrate-binding domain-containing protein [Sedimenticola sp.]
MLIKKSILFVLVSIVALNAAALKPLPMVTLEHPPFNYRDQKTGEIVGSTVHILREVLERIGYEPVITMMPWKRAQHETTKGKFAGLFTLTKSPNRLEIYHYVDTPVLTSVDVFFKMKSNNLTWNKFSDLQGLRLGLNDGYNYPDAYKNNQHVFENVFITGPKPELQALQMLMRGRIDLYMCSINICTTVIRFNQDKLHGIDYMNKPIQGFVNAYIAFSKKWPGGLELRDKFEKEYKKYIEEGGRDRAHKLYHVVSQWGDSFDGGSASDTKYMDR